MHTTTDMLSTAHLVLSCLILTLTVTAMVLQMKEVTVYTVQYCITDSVCRDGTDICGNINGSLQTLLKQQL